MTSNATPEPQQGLTASAVSAVLASHNESCNIEQVSFYPTLEALVDTVRSSNCWAEGEVFVWAPGDTRYIIMKQVAPSSCEMLTISPTGINDVLTAYRFTSEELVAELRRYLDSAGA